MEPNRCIDTTNLKNRKIQLKFGFLMSETEMIINVFLQTMITIILVLYHLVLNDLYGKTNVPPPPPAKPKTSNTR